MTALRVTSPSRLAIWLALRPSDQSFFSASTLSSVQVIEYTLLEWNPQQTRPRTELPAGNPVRCADAQGVLLALQLQYGRNTQR